jgi:hypothetical protein
MWILQWLPDWIFYAIFFVGLLGLLATYVMKFIPLVNVYRTPIQAISILAIAIGTYMSGAISNEEAWQAKVKEMEAKVALAEEQSRDANTKLEAKTQKTVIQLVEKKRVLKQYIDREIVKYDNSCTIPNEFIEAHNKAAKR